MVRGVRAVEADHRTGQLTPTGAVRRPGGGHVPARPRAGSPLSELPKRTPARAAFRAARGPLRRHRGRPSGSDGAARRERVVAAGASPFLCPTGRGILPCSVSIGPVGRERNGREEQRATKAAAAAAAAPTPSPVYPRSRSDPIVAHLARAAIFGTPKPLVADRLMPY
ncbi:hypothetical protein ABZP36_018583 [Zizania latifolia]